MVSHPRALDKDSTRPYTITIAGRSGEKNDMNQEQRNLFAKGLVDLANVVAGALVFGQLVSGEFSLAIFAVGILVTITFYLGALGVAKENKIV